MPKINQLSFEVANLIAAGEVVERPASVVKELLENAIDAQADAVTVEISRGGVTLIRVADNGVGMTAEDLPLAIKRHATSKISGAEDLDSIATLGFRGEALAATAAVSTLTIITKTKEADVGTMLLSVAGEVKEISEVGCADGTTVTVEELFLNVPARRKFLKKDVTETAAVTAVVEKIAISRPDIAIRYITDGTVRFVTTGDGNLAHTL
ncbi:MAG: DNA mismatch repair protein MutL, partial [Ruminococcaceae bacterium]|nr:DNA mismatch repair protein MutL [Oscillospiraceae bacterium]